MDKVPMSGNGNGTMHPKEGEGDGEGRGGGGRGGEGRGGKEGREGGSESPLNEPLGILLILSADIDGVHERAMLRRPPVRQLG